MTDLLNITLQGREKLVAKFRTMPGLIEAALGVKMQKLMWLLAGKIQATKLSGQVLAVRKGWLRGSVHALPTEVQPGRVTGKVGAASPPAGYGVFLERGVGHAWTILAGPQHKALKFILGSKERFARQVQHPPLSARPFMASSAEEARAWIVAQLQAAIDSEMEKS